MVRLRGPLTLVVVLAVTPTIRLKPDPTELFRATELLRATQFTRAPSGHRAHSIPVIPQELLNRPVTIRANIGKAHDAVSTKSPEAQAFYDQGLAYLHAHVWIEAARAFNQALRIDRGLALAYVGLSIAFDELNRPGLAREAVERAGELGANASEHDRLHIAARVAQLAAKATPGDARSLTAYRKTLDDALAKRPTDAELLMLRGMAESSDPADRGQGSTVSSIAYYEKALAAGGLSAHHFLTHALENAGSINQALPHAAAYARLAPTIPHALHMNGHVLRRAGHIIEAVAAFEAADRAQREYLARERIPPEYDWHNEHNLSLLSSSYRYLGQMAKAEQKLKVAFNLPSLLVVQMNDKRAWPEFLIARDRVDEAVAAANVLVAHPVSLVRAIGYIELAHATLTARRFDEATAASNSALAELRAASDGRTLVAAALQQIQGQILLRTGQRARGEGLLRDLVRKLRMARGPDDSVQTLFTMEAIARTARDADDWTFARWVSRQMIDHDATYAGGHYALALVADHNGDALTARAELALAGQYWRNAEPTLVELSRIRTTSGVRRGP